MTQKIRKILIANRGEIACRIIKTAREMNIECVCIYSDSDSRSSHVKRADTAVYVGDSVSTQSYLNMEKIVQIATEHNVDAVHPGYGFLAENPKFPKLLSQVNIGFIGPSSRTIELMGDKIKAKEIAKSSGVNLIPGYIGIIANFKEAIDIASSIGFPIILKAVSGGGGKGMRVVHSAKEMKHAFESATAEAEKTAKDSRLFIEKYIISPRHIEMQMAADKHGNIVYLGERECSIQRKNQKIIEEAPSSFMTEEKRKIMGEQCVNLFKKVGYHSVGTVEFIVDKNKNFYFLEVNTRLQVEHPVTELVTNIDLVKEMIRIEEGHELSFQQESIFVNGWAFEARIYAENPSKNFIPSSGRLSYYKEPQVSKNIRIDSGVFEGHEVTTFYDPMIAKVSTHGKNRKEAIDTMLTALEGFYIRGIDENLNFLQSIFQHTEFINGNIQTDFIEKHYANTFLNSLLEEEDIIKFTLATLFLYSKNKLLDNANQEKIEGLFTTVINEQHEKTMYCKFSENKLSAIYSNRIFSVHSVHKQFHGLLHLVIDNETCIFQTKYNVDRYELYHKGKYAVAITNHYETMELRKFLETKEQNQNAQSIISPISGIVTTVYVKADDILTNGQHICSIEAMKMENIVCFDYDKGVVESVHISKGSNIKTKDLIIKLKQS